MAAGEIFAAKGFSDATVREICEQADVNVASVNYYFGDKQTLYLEAVRAARETRAQEYPLPNWDKQTKAEIKLRDFIGILMSRLVAMESEPWQVRLLMREILQPTNACRHLVEDYFRPVFGILKSIIVEIASEPITDADTTRIGFSIVGQCLYYRLATGLLTIYLAGESGTKPYSKSDLSEHIFQFSLAAIQNWKKRANDSSPAPTHLFASRTNIKQTIDTKTSTSQE